MPAAAPEPERLFDGTLIAARDAPVGGQAVLEGVMMCGVSTWAVAVRAPAPEQVTGGRRLQSDEAALGEIKVQSFPLVSALKRHRVLRLPIIRGVVALGESLKLGFRALNISANAQLPADEEPISGGTWAGYWLFGSRIVGIPLVAGLAFEVIKWFGRNRSKPWVRVLMARPEAPAAHDARAGPRPARSRDRGARCGARCREARRGQRGRPHRDGGRRVGVAS